MQNQQHLQSESRTDVLQGRRVAVAHRLRHHMYHTAQAYKQADCLGAFITQTYVHRPERLKPLMALPSSISDWIKKYAAYHAPELSDQVWIYPRNFIDSLVSRGLGAHTLMRRQTGFEQAVSRACIENDWACHMACTQASETFQACHDAGLPCILEQYIADRRTGRQVLEEEYDYWGLSSSELKDDATFNQAKIDCNEAEYELADLILAISPFVENSLIQRGIAPERIVLAELGVDTADFPAKMNRRDDNEPLQIAFVGSDFIRKGLIHLLKAVEQVGPRAAHVRVFGGVDASHPLVSRFESCATFYGPLSRANLVRELHQCHAAALPSLWEGFAMAVYEAMATGLPNIVSCNVPAKVTDGVDGFVVPIHDSESIAVAIEKLREEPKRQEMSRQAVQTAQNADWDRYRRGIIQGLGLTG